jgi:hypothetical protein
MVMTSIDTVLLHIRKLGSISIREAMDDYSMSGGSLTKYISILKREGNDIVKVWKIHPLTGKRYARYYAREFLPVKYAA